ncbi:unnamed protein product [Symbiodinium sp. KB8]|nr:unnamed protein product [Symbiodinium sp. KB8]
MAHRAIQNMQLALDNNHMTRASAWYDHGSVKFVDATDEDQEMIMKGVGCYCKKVESREDCPSIKANHDVSAPNRYRWYHEDAGEGLCCKMAWTSLFTWVGFHYKRQETMDLCVSEVRPAPSAACCHLKNKQGSVGLRVKQTNSEAWVEGSSQNYGATVERRFWKVSAVSLEDVLGSTDHTGGAIDVEDVRGFVENGLDAGRFLRLECEETELIEDSKDCLLRTRASSECCCHQATLTAAERCLPVYGAPNNTEDTYLEGSYHEVGDNGHQKGSISFPPGPNAKEREILPEIVHAVDPEMVDDITTDANESEMVFPWGQNPQWTSICVMKQKVAYVRSQRHSKRVRSGTHCHRIGKTTHCRPTYRTKHWTTYHQEYSDKCIKYKFTRTCSAGHAFYEKQFPPGVCAREPTDENDDSVQLQARHWQFELHVP